MLITDIKINNKEIFKLTAVRYKNTKPEGLNAYKCIVIDEEGNEKDFLVAHQYEDGALLLVKRMIDKICSEKLSQFK
jgi:hypothetical protein